MSTRILVTGGAGYIGSTLVDELLSAGYEEVTVLDNLAWGSQGLSPFLGRKSFKHVAGDIRDRRLVGGVVAGKDVVVHLAALVGYGLCESHRKQAVDVNVNGSRVIADCLSEDQLLIYASTGSVYGQVVGYTCNEETLPNPQSKYAVTKLEAERIFSTRKNSVIFRFATAFGTSHRMRLDLLVNQFVYEALNKKVLLVNGGDYPRSTIHVRDIAHAIIFAIQNREMMKGKIFNVSSSEVITKGQIAKRIKAQFDFDLQFTESYPNLGCRDYQLATQKIEALGYHANVSLDQGLGELICAVKDLQVDRNCFNFSVVDGAFVEHERR